MREAYVVIDAQTGELKWSGAGKRGASASQILPDGLVAVIVPTDEFGGPLTDPETVAAAFQRHKISL